MKRPAHDSLSAAMGRLLAERRSSELAGLEAAYRAIPTAFTRVADRLRDLQTGVLSYNMLGLLLGVILLALSLLFFGGALGGLF